MDSAPVPQYQPPPDDPQYLALKAQAEQDKIAALQDRAGMDSASLMARYGARLTTAAAAGGGGSSPAAPAPPVDQRLGGTGGMSDIMSTVLRLTAGQAA